MIGGAQQKIFCFAFFFLVFIWLFFLPQTSFTKAWTTPILRWENFVLIPDEKLNWKILKTNSLFQGEVQGNGPYQYDLVDVGRQVLSNLFADVHALFEIEYQQYQFHNRNHTDGVKATGLMLLQILKVGWKRIVSVSI